MNNKPQISIGVPCRNRVKFCNEALRHMLKNSLYPIIVIDDNSDNPDGEYLQNERITVIYNKNKKGIVSLWNQLIKATKTEYVMICSDKIRLKNKDFALIEKKLQEGFGFVATYSLHCFTFSKLLLTKIGFPDEGFTNSTYEDSDYERRLFINNIGIYFSFETESAKLLTGWKETSENKRYYQKKWIEDNINKTLSLLHDEVNYNDRAYYRGAYKERDFLPWNKSVIKSPETKKYFDEVTFIDKRNSSNIYKMFVSIKVEVAMLIEDIGKKISYLKRYLKANYNVNTS